MKNKDVTDFWRVKGNLSKSLILMEIARGNSKLMDIGKSIGMTTQAVSYYVKEMENQGLLDDSLRLTIKGKEFLQKVLSSMSNFVSRSYMDSGIILSCEAVASEHIRSGDRVYLYMDEGELYATRKKVEGSSGVSLDEASPGEAIRVEKLEGIVKIEFGKLYMTKVDLDYCRDPQNIERILSFIRQKKIKQVFVFGTLAKVFAKKLGIEFNEFAPVEGSYEACAKGFNSLLIYSPEILRYLYLKIAENINKYGLDPVSVEI